MDAETADVMNGPGRVVPAAASDADWAVTALFRDHHLELVRLALVMVGDMATAEDVVQDAFEHLHKRWSRLREPGSGLAYARSSVLNGCRSVHRRSAVARRHVARLAGPSGAGPDAEAALADRGRTADVDRSAGDRLPPLWPVLGDHGRRLAYLSDKLPGLLQPQDAGVRMHILDTARPGQELTGSSTLVPLRTAGAVIGPSLITDNGSMVIAWIGPSPLSAPVVLGEFSARTGQLLRVLYRGPGDGVRDFLTDGYLLVADPSGRHVLIIGTTALGSTLLGRVDNGRFTALPSPSPSSQLVGAAW